jgi:hypothetical protein
MNKEQQDLLDKAYENYSKEYEKDNSIGMCLLVARMDGKKTYRKPNKEMFVGLCTSDKTFSENWGLTIEERELSWEERLDLLKKLEIFQERVIDNVKSEMIHSLADSHSIPTKLITIKYNDKKIESYE